jgi:hypothetical protein
MQVTQAPPVGFRTKSPEQVTRLPRPVFNGVMVWRRIVLVSIAMVTVAAACGRTGDQYVENDDATVFAKVPDRWEILDRGVVNTSVVPGGESYQGLPGDDTLPWRLSFAEDFSTDRPQVAGIVEVQPIDRRYRDDPRARFLLLGFDPGDTGDGIEVWNSTTVQVGDLDGLLLTYRISVDGSDEPRLTRALVATDIRRSAAYLIRAGCGRECFYANQDVIEDVVRSLYVEDES